MITKKEATSLAQAVGPVVGRPVLRSPRVLAGKMRVEVNVPRDLYCPRCGTRMTPASTPKYFRWFKCRSCGKTHRHYREFAWVQVRQRQ